MKNKRKGTLKEDSQRFKKHMKSGSTSLVRYIQVKTTTGYYYLLSTEKGKINHI